MLCNVNDTVPIQRHVFVPFVVNNNKRRSRVVVLPQAECAANYRVEVINLLVYHALNTVALKHGNQQPMVMACAGYIAVGMGRE